MIIANIQKIYVKNTSIANTYARHIWIRYIKDRNTCIKSICAKNAIIKDIELETLARLRIILANLKINDYYF